MSREQTLYIYMDIVIGLINKIRNLGKRIYKTKKCVPLLLRSFSTTFIRAQTFICWEIRTENIFSGNINPFSKRRQWE